jgi:tetratricopeptide (TPR) repeat protein
MTMILTLTTAVLSAVLSLQDHQHATSPAFEHVGTVKFETTCTAPAQAPFARGMALLHSFEFGPAIESFNAAAAADPGCGIAYWGVALSRWGNPFAAGIKPPAAIQAGNAAVASAKKAGARSERETAFIDAVANLFTDGDTVNQRTRVLAYRDAMKQVTARYPKDPEASAFYALALASSQDPTDMTYASLLEAGQLLEKLVAAQPDHPGFVHYVIHAYDAPPLASKALDAARRYAKIAPSAPHALHMPSHTFTRLGYWKNSIDTNRASADAARRVNSVFEELHATDYQMYAYLQLAQDASAKRVLDELPVLRARFNAPNVTIGAAPPMGGAYALAAVPARYALERRAWAEAAALEVTPSAFPNADAISWFAKGLGAARTKDADGARAAAAALEQIAAKLDQAGEKYWAEQAKIQHLGVVAWTAFAEGRTDEALKTMREAADREDKTEKNAVTPGPISPAREQLGEMLLELKQPQAALEAFQITLKKEPNRYRALAGAAEAERQTLKPGGRSKFDSTLLALVASTDGPPRPEVAALKARAKR